MANLLKKMNKNLLLLISYDKAISGMFTNRRHDQITFNSNFF